MNIEELNKLHPEKYVLVTYEYEYPIYIAPLHNLEIQICSKKEDAEVWSYADMLSEAKLSYHKIATGYKELVWELQK
ncbi:hypothetical protein ACFS7Z_22285 [Pontibacter toksunensis]|uniref:Uncharacterized protein n=1 Tax=Pontibacter toksunensis TaxID=1332631 RepID=A0ABW6C4N3_9BACT